MNSVSLESCFLLLGVTHTTASSSATPLLLRPTAHHKLKGALHSKCGFEQSKPADSD